MKTSSEIIDGLGGTAKTAKICGVTMGAVSQWRTNGIPKLHERYLRLAYPSVFGLPCKKAGTSIKAA